VSIERVLVTGGAGFIGSHVVDALLAAGRRVTVLDSLDPQVHGPERRRPKHLADAAHFVLGDVRDAAVVGTLVAEADAVIHLAAVVGLAQSMYEMERFVDVNSRGTAVLLQEVVRKGSPVRKILVASSMSLYGEGRCLCATCGPFDPMLRSEEQLNAKDFEVHCPKCRAASQPVGTPEAARLVPTTVYAVTKRDQEELVLSVGAAYDVGAVALRLFNVYGPRQALSNPYTGVAAIFSSRLLNDRPPVVFEDGLQTRDFVHVRDVASAFVRALDAEGAVGKVLNVGTGRAFTLLELGELLGTHIGRPFRPEITQAFRKGDIRHCSADTTSLQAATGFRPQIDFREGVADLVSWVRSQRPVDAVDRAMAELRENGLLT
jgi:dTDP-L-rhamnose 4-epimerase